MATWQFDVALIPRDEPLPRRGEEGYECAPTPKAKVHIAQAWLQQHMGNPWAMMEAFDVFGDDLGDRVDLLLNDDGSAELSARLDARQPSGQFVAGLCELARLIDCQFFSPETWSLIPPDEAALGEAFARSRASRFVEDPRGFIDALSKGRLGP